MDKNEQEMDVRAQVEADAAVAEVVRCIRMLLNESKLPEELPASAHLRENPEFDALVHSLLDLRTLGAALGRGDLQQMVYSRGYILSNLKALQANLRHMTWQTQQIASGDFTQRLDFLGDFSRAFNDMVLQLEDMTCRLQEAAAVDVLTGVPNRLSLEHFLQNAFAQARSAGTPLSAMIFDIDHFKNVNDTYGHLIGDEVLVAVSRTLGTAFRSSDLLARFGGEEFIAVLPNAPPHVAEQVAWRVLKSVEALRIETAQGPVSVTISAGVSQYLPEDVAYQDMVDRCDKALYQAKRSGRNRVCRA